MAFQPFPDGYQAVLEYGQLNDRWTNTLWFKNLTPAADNGQLLADFLQSWAGTEIMPQLSTNWSIQSVRVYDMDSSIGTVWFSTGAPVAGSVVGTVAPVSPALVISFYSSARGRSGRGRNFLTGFSEDDMGPYTINNPLRVTNLAQAYETLRTTVQAATNTYWVVASRQQAGVVLPEIEGFQVLYSVARNATLASQRRRIARE